MVERIIFGFFFCKNIFLYLAVSYTEATGGPPFDTTGRDRRQGIIDSLMGASSSKENRKRGGRGRAPPPFFLLCV